MRRVLSGRVTITTRAFLAGQATRSPDRLVPENGPVATIPSNIRGLGVVGRPRHAVGIQVPRVATQTVARSSSDSQGPPSIYHGKYNGADSDGLAHVHREMPGGKYAANRMPDSCFPGDILVRKPMPSWLGRPVSIPPLSRSFPLSPWNPSAPCKPRLVRGWRGTFRLLIKVHHGFVIIPTVAVDCNLIHLPSALLKGTFIREFCPARNTAYIPTSVTDATARGYSRREDDVALLAKFIRRVSVVYPHPSVTDSSQMRSRTTLRSYGKTMRRGCLGASIPNSHRVARINVVLS